MFEVIGLVRVDMIAGVVGRLRGLGKAHQDQLQLARIGDDVSRRIDASILVCMVAGVTLM